MLRNILIAYLIGSFPSAYIVGKINNVDLTKIGSGNLGATNVYRALGIKWAILVGIFDIIKGFLPVYFFNSFFYAIPAVLGHAFSVWIGFKGGKGIATFFGGLIAYYLITKNFQPLLFFLIIWANVFVLSRIMSLSTLSGVLASIISFIFSDREIFPFSLLLLLIIYWLHRENIKRLIKGKEKRVERVKV